MVVNESRRIIYANDVARWALGLERDVSLNELHLQAVEGGLLDELTKQSTDAAPGDALVMQTLHTVLEEEWTAAAALVTFEGQPATAVVIGRRPLRRGDDAGGHDRAVAAGPRTSDHLLRQVGLARLGPGQSA